MADQSSGDAAGPLTYNQAALELDRSRIVKDVDELTYDAINEMLQCQNMNSLVQVAGAEKRLAKIIKFWRITLIATTPGVVFTLKDLLQYEKGGDSYHGFYDQARTYLNTLFNAGVIDRYIGPSGEYIYASKNSNPADVERRIEKEEKQMEKFKALIGQCTEDGKLVRCPWPNKGKVCGAKIERVWPKPGSKSIVYSKGLCGHNLEIDAEYGTMQKIKTSSRRTG